jgi:nucleoside recognition membrane protein YjiH
MWNFIKKKRGRYKEGQIASSSVLLRSFFPHIPIMLLFITGLCIACVYSMAIFPSIIGSEPAINPTLYPLMYKGMIIIPYSSRYAIHFHHWVLYLMVCGISVLRYVPEVFTGFSLGLVIQGLTYKDRCNFLCTNPYN